MRSILICGAAAFALSMALPAAAQDSSSAGASPDQGAAPSTSAAAPASNDAAAPIAAGLSVKDKTGAVIGQITDVKAAAGGKQTATIAMGADTFAVDTASLAVQDGAAVINASQDELKSMIKKASPAASKAGK